MILVENRNFLRLHHRQLLELLKKIENKPSPNLETEDARSGKLTLKVSSNDGFRYMHSKYDPEKEADQLMSRISDLDQCDHIVLIGAGLGYMLFALAKAYPKMRITVFEPNASVLVQLLSHYRLDKLAASIQLITCDQQELENFLFESAQKKQEKIQFFVLPFYEQSLGSQIKEMMRALNQGMRLKANNIQTNIAFQQRWTLNVLKNFPTIIKTPNILLDIKSDVFKNKPVILVSAGPSLDFEWENLKKIKQEGLAYIFSVGSAINALIKHDIYPDALCTYDPQGKNAQVVQIVVERQIQTIPLIFGSSVGYETLDNYPGPMAHMLISEDTLSPQLLSRQDGRQIPVLFDQPSIAVVTLELLARLQAAPIILVGQNLGFLKNQFYASGIAYEGRTTELNAKEKESTLMVESVDGDQIQTSESFLSMQKQMEEMLAALPQLQVINTTQGGAAIKGTSYIPLSKVIHDQLKDRVVQDDWHRSQNSYDYAAVQKKLERLKNDLSLFIQFCGDWQKTIIELNERINKGTLQQIDWALTKCDKCFRLVQKNKFFITLIAPMIKVQMDHIHHVSEVIRFEKDVTKKASAALKELDATYVDCVVNYKLIAPVFDELIERVMWSMPNKM